MRAVLPSAVSGREARARQARLTKPCGSLGRLEDLACWFAERLGDCAPAMPPAEIFVFAADHGVAAQGVSAFPREVTAQMVENFARGGAAINVLARLAGVALHVVDVGVATRDPVPAGVRGERIRAGTRDLANEAAMAQHEAEAAVAVGRRCAAESIERGTRLLIAGDMGIGNTTSAAALICAITGKSAGEIVGRGTGIGDAALARKRCVVEAAVARVQARRPVSPRAVLAEVGGLELAALVGFYLEGTDRQVPLLLDGFITTAAALVAVAMNERTRDWLLASHLSAESGHALALSALGLRPLLDLSLRLGEGTGAALALPIIRAALALHRDMATFDEAGVSSSPAPAVCAEPDA